MVEPGTDSTLSTPVFLVSAIALIIIWGSAFTMVGVGVDYITPIWLVAERLIFGAIVITAFAYISGERLPGLKDVRWRWYFLLGITGNVLPFYLLSTGQLDVDSGTAAIIVGFMPLMTVFLAHYFANERLTFPKLLGFALGFVGIVILFLPDDFSLSLVSEWKAQLLLVGGAFCYAVTTILAKRAPHTQASVAASMMLICAAVTALPLAFLSEPFSMPEPTGILMVIGLGLGSSGFATIIFLYVIEKSGPSSLAKINYFTPVASVIFGVWLLGEDFTLRIFIALLVIIVGVLISNSGRKRPVTTSSF